MWVCNFVVDWDIFFYSFDLFLAYLTTLHVSQTTGTPPTCAVLTFRKVRRQWNFTKVRIYRTYGCLCLYVLVQWIPAAIKTRTHWNMIGRRITATPPMLSPSSILPPLSSHCAFIAARKCLVRFSKIIKGFPFKKNCQVGACLHVALNSCINGE